MGYVGECAALAMMTKHGHRFDFNGYGAGSFEIYRDERKKRKRTADLVCSLCGQRLEVRAKKRLQISMSDSATRRFDAELPPDVWVGFIKVALINRDSDSTVPESYCADSELYTIRVSELSKTRNLATISTTKKQDAGSESYLTWPTVVAPCDGIFSGVQRGELRNTLTFTASNGKAYVEDSPSHGNSYLYNGICDGSPVRRYSTLVAGVAKTVSARDLRCIGHKPEISV